MNSPGSGVARELIPRVLMILAMAVSTAIGPVAHGADGNTNRVGGDYRSFDLATSIGGYSSCESACMSESRCKAWTFVKSGIQGPKARCWLKSTVPPASANGCCVSGVKGSAALPKAPSGGIKLPSDCEAKWLALVAAGKQPSVSHSVFLGQCMKF